MRSRIRLNHVRAPVKEARPFRAKRRDTHRRSTATEREKEGKQSSTRFPRATGCEKSRTASGAQSPRVRETERISIDPTNTVRF